MLCARRRRDRVSGPLTDVSQGIALQEAVLEAIGEHSYTGVPLYLMFLRVWYSRLSDLGNLRHWKPIGIANTTANRNA